MCRASRGSNRRACATAPRYAPCGATRGRGREESVPVCRASRGSNRRACATARLAMAPAGPRGGVDVKKAFPCPGGPKRPPRTPPRWATGSEESAPSFVKKALPVSSLCPLRPLCPLGSLATFVCFGCFGFFISFCVGFIFRENMRIRAYRKGPVSGARGVSRKLF